MNWAKRRALVSLSDPVSLFGSASFSDPVSFCVSKASYLKSASSFLRLELSDSIIFPLGFWRSGPNLV